MFLHVIAVKYLQDYELDLSFSDGRKGVADLSESLSGSVFQPLRDQELFAQAVIDPELQTVVWPNGEDFAPEYLYFLAFKDDASLQERFAQWGYTAEHSATG